MMHSVRQSDVSGVIWRKNSELRVAGLIVQVIVETVSRQWSVVRSVYTATSL